MHPEDIDALEAKYICHDCVRESFLSAEIARTGEVATCDYCGETETSWTVGDLAVGVEKAFENHYVRTPDQPDALQQSLLGDRESNYNWYRDGYPVVDAIEGATEIPREAAEDVQAILEDKYGDFESHAMGEETEFSSESYYDEKGASTGVWQQEWNWFEHSLKTEARFFSKTAAAHLASVFGGIDKIKTRSGRRLVVHTGPKRKIDHLYRARVFQGDDRLEEALCRPDQHLGSPPAHLATAGRMNARGISVFYGATSLSAAVAEVRPPVGSRVAVAKFQIMRPLRLLDLTALDDAIDSGSVFDPTLKQRLERVAFLRSLGQRMTRPVMPDDEALDYLITQAIADFLATENQPVLDGIIYRSVQVKGGRNVVLFHKAARVETLELPGGTDIQARSYSYNEDGPEIDYCVSEMVPPPTPPPPKDDSRFFSGPFLSDVSESVEWDGREATLRIDLESVEVHWINWVAFRSTRHAVARHRFEKNAAKDDF